MRRKNTREIVERRSRKDGSGRKVKNEKVVIKLAIFVSGFTIQLIRTTERQLFFNIVRVIRISNYARPFYSILLHWRPPTYRFFFLIYNRSIIDVNFFFLFIPQDVAVRSARVAVANTVTSRRAVSTAKPYIRVGWRSCPKRRISNVC